MEKWDAYDGHLNKIEGLTLIRVKRYQMVYFIFAARL